MSYQQLSFMVQANDVESLSEALDFLGALGVTWADAEDIPIYEPAPNTIPLWDKVIVTGLFGDDIDLSHVKRTLAENHAGMIPIDEQVIADENWVEKSLADFKPIAFPNHLWICPSWQHVDDDKATLVRLNPGLAFGTGEHATTQMIVKYLATHPPRNNTVVDYGCGSGILGITACLLGATHVYATDIDEQALIATKNNAQLNNIHADKITIAMPDHLMHCKVDQLLANIFLVPLLELRKNFTNLLKPGGEILLSGVLHDQAAQIFATYQDDFYLTIVDQQHGWLLFHGLFKK